MSNRLKTLTLTLILILLIGLIIYLTSHYDNRIAQVSIPIDKDYFNKQKKESVIINKEVAGKLVKTDFTKEYDEKFISNKNLIKAKEVKKIVKPEILQEDSNIKKQYISKYKIDKRNIKKDGVFYKSLRSFTIDGIEKILAVNLDSNKTEIFNVSEVIFTDNSNYYINSKYKKALDIIATRKGYANTGLKNDIHHDSSDMYLTADFCPSRKDWFEKDFFNKFIAQGHKNISIAITKSWVDKHKSGFNWLLDKQRKGILNITWINHSSNHRYDFGESDLNKNFLLLPNTNIEEEILDVEKMLISYGETPSIFIRFPGLISNKELRKDVIQKYGLISIGSDAWLAKGEKPKGGSIILIHGNGNEHNGIIKAVDFLNDNQDQVFGELENSI